MSYEGAQPHKTPGHLALSPFGIGVRVEDFIDPDKPTVRPDSPKSPTRKAHELGGAALSIEVPYLTIEDAEHGLAEAVAKRQKQIEADWQRIVGDCEYEGN